MAANLFKKAAAKVADAPSDSKKKRETVWRVGAHEDQAKLAGAITALVGINGELKALETKAGLYKGVLKAYAEDRWLEQYGGQGVQPETPMKLVNAETGESVTFVVQDRSNGHAVKDDVADALAQIMGEGAAASALFEQVTFGFHPAVMAQPLANGQLDRETGEPALVQDWLGEKLGAALDRAVKEGVLTQEQVEGLLEVKQVRTFRPGFFDRLPHLCGLNVGRVSSVLQAVGSAIVRYVRA